MFKKVVRYSQVIGPIEVGYSVLVVPVDHPDEENVSNNVPASTSRVVSYNEETEEFETMNTFYTPA